MVLEFLGRQQLDAFPKPVILSTCCGPRTSAEDVPRVAVPVRSQAEFAAPVAKRRQLSPCVHFMIESE